MVIVTIVNAGFLVVAMSVATALAAPAKQARATATTLSGVTLSCVAGVPARAMLGDWSGWRSAFWAVAALCLPALVLVFRSAPAGAVHVGVPDGGHADGTGEVVDLSNVAGGGTSYEHGVASVTQARRAERRCKTSCAMSPCPPGW